VAVSRIALLGLPFAILGSTAFGQDAPPPSPPLSAAPSAPTSVLPGVTIVGSTPLLGAGFDRNQVPAATNILTPADIARTGPASLTAAMDDNIPSVNLDDLSGNRFQPSLLFRGFIASPNQGDEQGLAVYVNGARFNQPFGDTVNWDLIPSNAISQVNVEGGNPVFGLNALGGSVNVQLKNGFTYHGGEMVAYGGSFGTAAGQFQYGRQSGNTAIYFAGDIIQDQGYRNTSGSTLYQSYTDIGWRGREAEIHFGITADSTSLGNPGATPVELLAVNRAANSTAPNLVTNKYLALNLNGNFDVTDETSLQGLVYYANLSQRIDNGITVDSAPCTDGSGNLCTGEGNYLTGLGGNPIPDFLNGGTYGGVSYQGIDSNAYGASTQVSNTHPVFGLPNHIVAGFSFDGGGTTFTGSQTVGLLTPARYVVEPQFTVDQADLSIAPVRLFTTNRYYGLFFTDLLSLTPKLTLSVSGRFNLADINLYDQIGTSLNGTHSFNHFNPGAGATYQVLPNLAVFASYAVSNRAPTPSELSCASPAQPCQLPNFFIGDPNLKQVVATTYEAGVRGSFTAPFSSKAVWNIDLFRTDSNDDIIYQSSVLDPNGGYYTNAGTTRRQGVEANLTITSGKLHAMLGYALVDATFQSPLTLSSPSNPYSDANGLIYVVPGNKIPGVPENRLKFVVAYDITDRWTVGGNGIFTSGQYLFGDEANQTSMLPSYFLLNLNTKYRITDHIELFALVDNVLNRKYSTYGLYAPVAGLPAPELPAGVVTNQRAESPAAPVAAYGGVRVTF
jgi:outer membrane receptor protein involved in Fe transport